MPKIDSTLFSNAGGEALAQAYGECPECGGQLQQRFSKQQSFIGCSNYPKCTYIQNPKQVEDSTIKVMSGMACPQCGEDLAIKKGKYGMFIGCTSFPSCHYIGSLNPSEDEEQTINCPECQTGHYVKRISKAGKTFWGCSQYPKCEHISNNQPQSE